MIRKHLLVALWLIFILQVTACSIPILDVTDSPTSRPKNIPTATLTSAINCSQTLTGGKTPRIPTLTVSQLLRCRPEVQTTINAIKRNGPFKYDQDDTVFANREGILPARPNGSYHEYTVVTPGASTRGTRRIVTAGSPGRDPADFTSMYYTDDHYQTAWLLQGY